MNPSDSNFRFSQPVRYPDTQHQSVPGSSPPNPVNAEKAYASQSKPPTAPAKVWSHPVSPGINGRYFATESQGYGPGTPHKTPDQSGEPPGTHQNGEGTRLHDLFCLDLRSNVLSCRKCGRGFRSLALAEEHTRTESSTAPDDDFPKCVICADFVAAKFFCINCGRATTTLQEAQKQWESEPCSGNKDHNICVQLDNQELTCSCCEESFATLNQAFGHWKDETSYSTLDPSAQPSTYHLVSVDFRAKKFTCRCCLDQPFDTVNDAASHAMDGKLPKTGAAATSAGRIWMAFGSGKFVCLNCSKPFDAFKDAVNHSKERCVQPPVHYTCIDFNTNQLVCRLCGKAFQNLGDAIGHWKNETFSHLAVYTIELLAKHKIYADFHSKTLSCTGCEDQFHDFKSAVEHWIIETFLQVEHKIYADFKSKQKILTCHECKKTYDTLEKAKEHWESKRPYRSPIHTIGVNFQHTSMHCNATNCTEIFHTFEKALEHYNNESLPVPPVDDHEEDWHGTHVNFDSNELTCKICKENFATLQGAAVHRKKHSIQLDFNIEKLVCHRCCEPFESVNSAARHWLDLTWPMTHPGVKISSKHEVVLNTTLSGFICNRCGLQLEIFNEVPMHWKAKKMNPVIKSIVGCTGNAGTAPCF